MDADRESPEGRPAIASRTRLATVIGIGPADDVGKFLDEYTVARILAEDNPPLTEHEWGWHLFKAARSGVLRHRLLAVIPEGLGDQERESVTANHFKVATFQREEFEAGTRPFATAPAFLALEARDVREWIGEHRRDARSVTESVARHRRNTNEAK